MACALCVFVQCRLEANYAHQQELDMIPLMMQKKYKPQGWRKSQAYSLRFLCRTSVIPLTCETSAAVGLIMGTRMWRVADHSMHSTLSVHCSCFPPFFLRLCTVLLLGCSISSRPLCFR